jgi:hypothetical protein
MKGTACTEERFLSNVEGHEMTILRDSGVYRHIRFKKAGTCCYYFDLITWPGHLCYTGDMGTYVFCRLEDMFEFFRTDRENMKSKEGRTLAINPGYWAEKVLGESKFGKGTAEFSEELFREALKSDFEEHFESRQPDDDADDYEKNEFQESKNVAWEAVENEILGVDSLEHDGIRAAMDFEHEGLRFDDFWDHSFMDFTFHFLWCCYAMAWGIAKYDTGKMADRMAA